MKVLRNIASQLHVYIIWLILSVVIWGFVFTHVTDAPAEKKVVLFADVYACRELELELELEKSMPDGIRMIRTHSFGYVVFGDRELLGADLYLIPLSEAERYLPSFLPLDSAALPWAEDELWYWEGVPYGVRMRPAESFLQYEAPGEAREDFALFFGVNSVHAASFRGSGDDAALAVARSLYGLD